MPSLKSSVGNSKNISLDDVCYLITVTSTGKDELNQDIETFQERPVFCSKLSISRAEFVAAGQLGYKPRLQLIVDVEEYDNENSLKYEGNVYAIYKTYQREDGFIELYCEVKVSG